MIDVRLVCVYAVYMGWHLIETNRYIKATWSIRTKTETFENATITTTTITDGFWKKKNTTQDTFILRSNYFKCDRVNRTKKTFSQYKHTITSKTDKDNNNNKSIQLETKKKTK